MAAEPGNGHDGFAALEGIDSIAHLVNDSREFEARDERCRGRAGVRRPGA
jgi:hypothetical protein